MLHLISTNSLYRLSLPTFATLSQHLSECNTKTVLVAFKMKRHMLGKNPILNFHKKHKLQDGVVIDTASALS